MNRPEDTAQQSFRVSIHSQRFPLNFSSIFLPVVCDKNLIGELAETLPIAGLSWTRNSVVCFSRL